MVLKVAAVNGSCPPITWLREPDGFFLIAFIGTFDHGCTLLQCRNGYCTIVQV